MALVPNGNEVTRRTFLALCGAAAVTAGLSPVEALAEGGADSDVSAPGGLTAPEGAGAINDAGEYTFAPEGELTQEDIPDVAVATAANDEVGVTELKGATRYETAAEEALHAFSSSKYAIVVSGDTYADAIAAAGLAGALNCPILLTQRDSVPSATKNTLTKLGVKELVLLGGSDVISSTGVSALSKVVGSYQGLSGATRYDTQMKIYQYGASKKLWSGDTAIVCTGEDFADALSASAISFAIKAPVFFCDKSKKLTDAAKQAVSSASQFKNFIVAGGTAVVSKSAFDDLSALAKKRGGSAVRCDGETRYQTSANLAKHAVNSLGFHWDGVAFASGVVPFDSLGGGVVQGKEKSVLLLADGTNDSSASYVKAGAVISGIKFFGGNDAIPVATRADICGKLGVTAYGKVKSKRYGITLDHLARLEAASEGANGIKYEQFYKMLDPSSYPYGSYQYLQFAELGNVHSGVSASKLDAYVSDNCIWQEQSYGRKSKLRNTGSYFVEAARAYDVNEVYLLAHAIWESAWGCSVLANGWTPEKNGEVVDAYGNKHPYKKGTTYYNLYGIGAYDNDPIIAGRNMAVVQGWTTPRAAILGAAKWISKEYLTRSLAAQNTLYLMKFDVGGAARTDLVWHQYCTGGNDWVLGIASVMRRCYASAGVSFEGAKLTYSIPAYAG